MVLPKRALVAESDLQFLSIFEAIEGYASRRPIAIIAVSGKKLEEKKQVTICEFTK